MKYLKYSVLLLLVAIITNYSVSLASSADERPVIGVIEINLWKSANTATKNKVNTRDQKIKMTESTCDDCKYNITTLVDGLEISRNVKVSLGEVKTLTGSGLYLGSTYSKINSTKFTLLNVTASYNYDPNAILL